VPEIDPNERTLVHALRRAVETAADKTWLATGDSTLTYAEIDGLSNRIANGFAAHGIDAGETVLFMMTDSPEFVATWVACSKAGVIEVPVNVAYRGDILEHVINDSRAQTMVCSRSFLDRINAVSKRLVHLKRCFVLDDQGDEQVDANGIDCLPFEDLISERSAAPNHMPAIWDRKAIMYTSGTTGRSKGVVVAQAHAFEYANGAAGMLRLEPGDVYYTAGLPLFHVAGKWGVVYAALQNGATAAFPERFSTAEFWNDVRHYGATTTFLLGAMANFLQRQDARADDADNPLERIMMCPLLPDTDDFASRFGVKVGTAYGSTEVNAPIFMAPGTPVEDVQCVGRVRADMFEVRVIDENDIEVAPGVLGEIAVRSRDPWVTMVEYWNAPESTAAMWRNQWLHSGDAGRYDEDGNYYFVDRIKDAIRRRGENISSMEVEGIVSQHPAIAECAVYPVTSAFSEQDVACAILVKEGQTVAPEDLIAWLEPRMAYFMVPRYVTIEAELPKTPTGKIQKYTLRATGVTAATWDREAAGITLKR